MVKVITANLREVAEKANQKYADKKQHSIEQRIEKLQLEQIADMLNNGATQQIIADTLVQSKQTISYRIGVIKQEFPYLLEKSKSQKILSSQKYDNDNDNDNYNYNDNDNDNVVLSSSSLTESKGWETVEKMKELYPFDAANSVETKADLMAFVIAYKGENFATARVNQQIKDTKVSPKDCARALYYLDAKEMKGRFCKGIEPTLYLCLKDENIVSANNYFEKEIAQNEAIAHSFQVAEENKKIIHARIPSPKKKTPTYNIDEIN